MMKWNRLMMLFVLLLAGCEELTGPVALTPTSTSAPGPASLVVVNESSEVICAVFLSGTLLDSRAIMPGEGMAFDIEPGTYDLRADNCFEVPLAWVENVTIDGPLAWRIVEGSGPGGEQ